MAIDRAAAAALHAVTSPGVSRSTVALGASTPLRLDTGNGWWLVKGGQIDLFAVALDRNEPVGVRHPLCRISAGELIAAFPGGDRHAVIAVGHLGSSVAPVTREEIATWPIAQQVELIDRWIGALAAAVYGDAPAWPELTAEPGRSVRLAAGTRLYAPRGAMWVVSHSGTLRIGDGRFAAPAILPIAAGLSAGAEGDAVVDLIATAAALESGADAEGLEPFADSGRAGRAYCASRRGRAAAGGRPRCGGPP